MFETPFKNSYTWEANKEWTQNRPEYKWGYSVRAHYGEDGFKYSEMKEGIWYKSSMFGQIALTSAKKKCNSQ